MQPVSIRQATSADLEALVPLFDGYRQFYGQPSALDRVRAFLHQRLTQALFVSTGWERDVVFSIHHRALVEPTTPTHSDNAH